MKKLMYSFATACVAAGLLTSCATTDKAAAGDSKDSKNAAVVEQTRAPSNAKVIYKFDFGGKGAAEGFTAVSAADGYSKEKGYGFANPKTEEGGGVKDTDSAGTAELSDAVEFLGNDSWRTQNTFNVDLEPGLYEITVNAGGAMFRESIAAEGVWQVMDLTGGINGVETWQMPVTDGQLNIAAVPGKGGTPFALCSMTIAKVSDDPKMAPTIWLCGDSTVCEYYPLPDNKNVTQYGRHGWGQDLERFVNPKWQVRNMATGGQRIKGFYNDGQHEAIMKYIKEGDYYLIAIGINDKNYKDDPDDYRQYLVSMINETRAKKAIPVLVYQQGRIGDGVNGVQSRWYGDIMESVAKDMDVKLVNLFKKSLAYYKTFTSVEDAEAHAPLKNMNDPNSAHDTLHLTPEVAEKLAIYVVEEMPELR
ncbi:MAG: hypothetical protein K6F69_01510 [Treponema sp.]|nr:hypothetical protein [Treponema sp.]